MIGTEKIEFISDGSDSFVASLSPLEIMSMDIFRMAIIRIESYLLCSADKLRSAYQIITLLAVIRSSLLPATLLCGFRVPRTALTFDALDGSHLLEFLNLKILFLEQII